MKSIDAVLNLSQIFGLPTSNEPGVILVEYLFSVVLQLVDASLDDEELLNHNDLEQNSSWVTKPQEMEIDGQVGHHDHDEKSNRHNKRLQNSNTVMAIEIIGQLLKNKGTSRILYLARKYMYEPRYLKLLTLWLLVSLHVKQIICFSCYDFVKHLKWL